MSKKSFSNITGTNWTWSGNLSTSDSIFSNAITTKTSADDVYLNEKSLTEIIQNIEKQIGILNQNFELEERWSKLKELGDKYRALEKELLNSSNEQQKYLSDVLKERSALEYEVRMIEEELESIRNSITESSAILEEKKNLI